MGTKILNTVAGWRLDEIKFKDGAPEVPAGLKVVCGWCQHVIAGSGVAEVIGICPRCLHRELKDISMADSFLMKRIEL